MSENKRTKFFVTMKETECDELLEEAYDDDLLLELAKLIAADEAQMTTVVKERVEAVELCAEILRQIVEGTNIWIECRIHDPYPSMGCVSVIGESFIIDDMTQFQRVAALASNIDIYTELSGMIHMDFTFHGLMRR